MKMKSLIRFIFLLMLGSNSFGQSPDQFRELADDAIREGDHYGAAVYYQKAFLLDSQNLAYPYNAGKAFRETNDYEKAKELFSYVVEKDNTDEYPLALYYQAEMEKYQGNYLQARELFEQYSKIYRYKSAWHTKKAKKELESCEWAYEHQFDSNKVEFYRYEYPINTIYSELSPWLSYDSSFYFAALRYDTGYSWRIPNADKSYFTEVLTVEKDTNEVYSISEVDDINESFVHTANYFFDSTFAVVTRCDDNCHIYAAKKENGEWSSFEYVEQLNRRGYESTQAFPVIIDGKRYVFFSSDFRRGEGKMDIWYSSLMPNDKFSQPQNLTAINTPGNEITPYYDTAHKALYFSSDWHNGFGGQDVFLVTGFPNDLSEPENLLHPINTSVNDLYFNRNDLYGMGFLVSNREGGMAIKSKTCCNEIYGFEKIEEPEVEEPVEPDTVKKPDTNLIVEEVRNEITQKLVDLKLLPLEMYFPNDQPDKNTYATTTEQTYFDVIETYRKELSTYTENNAGFKSEFYDYYVVDRDEILTALMDTISSLIEKDKRIQLGVQGYASPIASSKYNLNLAKRRIHSLVNTMTTDSVLNEAYIRGDLLFYEIPFGEFFSTDEVSDSDSNQINSVYSNSAALARKVSINWIEMKDQSVQLPTFRFSDPVIETLPVDEITIQITNTGNETLKFSIGQSPASIRFTQQSWSVPINETAELKIDISDLKTGVHKVVFNSNSYSEKHELFIKVLE